MPATGFPVEASTNRRHVPFIEQTRAFWQVRTQHAVTSEDARRIVSHATGFFRILSEWADRDAHETDRYSETTGDR